uniref:CYP82C154 n=1 Tax=Corydalis yanhusuo TaxID=458692 RepID=A0AA96NF93_9MAGN|nr:CYP82C154 [Corydalis yanhusuo]
MDIEFQTITVGGLICFIFLLCVHLWRKEKKSMPPELQGGWPIIGNLHQLGRDGGSNNTDNLLHRFFGSLADKLGPAFTIRIGMRRALVVSSWEITKECFTTNDRIFPTRPNSIGAKLMGYDSAMFGLAPYGPYWREMRKLTTLELLSNRRLEMLKGIRDTEIKISVKELYEIWVENGGKNPVLVEMKRWFGDLTFNVTVMMIAGKRYLGRNCDCDEDETRRAQKAFSEFMRLLGVFVISDAIPFLRFFDIQGYEKEMKRNGEDIDLVLGKWVSEHRDRKKKRDLGEEEEEQQKDFIDVMLSILDDEDKFFGRDVDTVIKSTCISLILGGYETSLVTLTWALSLLLNNPHILRKAQAELDIHVGKDRRVDESDVKNLVYIQAIIKETLRLYPAGPITPPRQAMEDCTVAGFHIPKGTQLMVNLWKLQRDPRVWSDPSEFKPERFLNGNSHADIDVRGQHFELIPFSSGRRGCPGISFAMQVLHLTLARLLHGFDFSTPSDKPIDMTESLGRLTCPKATPLEVLLAPRLPTMLYATE